LGTVVKQRAKPKFITLDTIEPLPMKWLWEPYIPLGTVTAIFGRGGQGKSFLTVDLASRLSTGTAFPDSLPFGRPQNVLMLSAEDDYQHVLVPRLIKQGADRRHIAVPDKKFTLDKEGAADVTEIMRDFAATIVFIDPIVFYAGGKMDMNKSNEVRAMMERLKDAAEAASAAVIIVGHVKKSDEGSEQDRMTGSADWVNAARSGILVTRTNDGTKIMKHVKTNYGELGPTRSFEITKDGFVWGDKFADDDLPTSSRSGRREQAIAFLRALLADAPAPATEVEQAAKDEGIAPATLSRAKAGIAESYYNKSAGVYYWRLLA